MSTGSGESQQKFAATNMKSLDPWETSADFWNAVEPHILELGGCWLQIMMCKRIGNVCQMEVINLKWSKGTVLMKAVSIYQQQIHALNWKMVQMCGIHKSKFWFCYYINILTTSLNFSIIKFLWLIYWKMCVCEKQSQCSLE